MLEYMEKQRFYPFAIPARSTQQIGLILKAWLSMNNGQVEAGIGADAPANRTEVVKPPASSTEAHA
jgi:hypothetical protein